MKIKNILISIALLTIVTGCSTRIADLTVASTKNIDLNHTDLVKGDRVEGADTMPIIFVPIGNINIKEAIDEAIENDRCAVGLSDVVVEQAGFVFLVFGYTQYTVEGNLIVDPSLNGCAQYSDPNYVRPAPVVE